MLLVQPYFGLDGTVFNAGSGLSPNSISTLAFLNTDIAASFAAITWMIIEWIREGKPKFVGFLTGAIAGLATITPAAGFVPLWAAMIIGVLAGIGCYIAVQFKNKLGWDDALDVWGVHGFSGMIGTILLGVFASKAISSQSGLIEGNIEFFIVQFVAVVVSAAYAFLFTYGMLSIINFITPVKVTEEQEEHGIDHIFHGEKAYDEGAF